MSDHDRDVTTHDIANVDASGREADNDEGDARIQSASPVIAEQTGVVEPGTETGPRAETRTPEVREEDDGGTAVMEPAEPTAGATVEEQPVEGAPGAKPAEEVREAPPVEATAPATQAEEPVALLGEDHRQRFQQRWDDIQASFVDEPRNAVAEADLLVVEVTQQLATTFADQRANLEGQWSKGESVSTEVLRNALRRYRGFFQDLLKV